MEFFVLADSLTVIDDDGNERQTRRRRIVDLTTLLAARDTWPESREFPEDQKRLARKRIEDGHRLRLRAGGSLDLRRLRSKGEQGLPGPARGDLPTADRALGEAPAVWGERALRGLPSWSEARMDLGEQSIAERHVLTALAQAVTGSGYYRQLAALVDRVSRYSDLHGSSEPAEVTWLLILDAADSVGDAVGRPRQGAGPWRPPRSLAAGHRRPARVRCGARRARRGIRRAWPRCAGTRLSG